MSHFRLKMGDLSPIQRLDLSNLWSSILIIDKETDCIQMNKKFENIEGGHNNESIME